MNWRYYASATIVATLMVGAARANEPPNVEIQGRGPLHEAFALPWEKDPAPNQVIAQQPPEPIAEEPPEDRPEGENVQWIPGYWQWDDEKNDFIWVSGFWRDTPTGRRWVPGYWAQTDEGYVWVNGHWAAEQEPDLQIVPEPPASLDEGPQTPPPDDNSFYIPGSWFYTETGYQWRVGYWADCREGYNWIPAQYFWTPRGWCFTSGYWDYAPLRRGLLFAPVYFAGRPFLNPGFVFRPSVAIAARLLFGSLFVRPRFGGYYFGDYYGAAYARRGFSPWINYGLRQYDPIFNYERWANRRNELWLTNLRSTYEARAAGRLAAPPRTFADVGRLPAEMRSQALLANIDQVRQQGVNLQRLSAQQVQAQRRAAQETIARSIEFSRAASQARLTNPGTIPPRRGGSIDGLGGRNPSTSLRVPTGSVNPGAGRGADIGRSRPPELNLPRGGAQPRLPDVGGGNRPPISIPNGGNRGGPIDGIRSGIGSAIGGGPASGGPIGGNRPPITIPNLGGNRGGIGGPIGGGPTGGSRPPISIPNLGGGNRGPIGGGPIRGGIGGPIGGGPVGGGIRGPIGGGPIGGGVRGPIGGGGIGGPRGGGPIGGGGPRGGRR